MCAWKAQPAAPAARRVDWRGVALSLSLAGCRLCMGIGMIRNRLGEKPCQCVLRGVFRVCWKEYARFQCSPPMPMAKLERLQNGYASAVCYSRPREEYCADFILAARRTLDAKHFLLFEMFWLSNADWKMCARKLGVDKGQVFHAVYRVEAVLGRAFAEMQPYGLYPVDEYLHGAAAPGLPAIPARVERRPGSLRFPTVPLLRRAA